MLRKATFNGRYASNDEDESVIKQYTIKLGKSVVKTLLHAFDNHARRDDHTVPVKQLEGIFTSLNKTISRTMLMRWLRDMDVSSSDSFTLVEFLYTYYSIFVENVVHDTNDDIDRSDTDDTKKKNIHRLGGDHGVPSIAAVASLLFANQECIGVRYHDQLIRRLSLGRDEAQVKMILRFKEIFERLDEDDNDGEIATMHLTSLLTELGRDPKTVSNKIDALCTRSASIALVEVFGEFGYLIQDASTCLSIPSAFAKLRLHTAVNEVRLVGMKCLEIARKVLDHPNNAIMWKIQINTKSFQESVGKCKGGKDLLLAIGFQEMPSTSGEIFMELVGVRSGGNHRGNYVSTLRVDLLDKLSLKIQEVESELAALDGAPSVAAVVREIKVNNTLQRTALAVETSLLYVNNVLKNPSDSRCWRIRLANPIYQRKMDAVVGAEALMQSVGFNLTETTLGSIFVLRGTQAPDGTVHFTFPKLTTEVEAFLWPRKSDLEVVLDAMEEEKATELGTQGDIYRASDDLKDATSENSPRKFFSPIAQNTHGMNVLSVLGKTEVQKAQLNMMKEAFRTYDNEGKGFLTNGDVRRVLRAVGSDSSEKAVREWIAKRDLTQDGVVSLAEFVAYFGPMIQPPAVLAASEARSTMVEIGLAFGQLRLSASMAECKLSMQYIIRILTEIITQPSIRSHWRRSTLAAEVESRVGRYPAAVKILQVCGFVLEENSTVLALHNTSGMPWKRVPEMEITAHTSGLEHPTTGDVGAVSAVIGQMYLQKDGKEWLAALEMVLLFANKILTFPNESKYRLIKSTNPVFMKRIGKLQGGIQVLISIGFRENNDGNFYLESDADLGALQARVLELSAGVDQLKLRIDEQTKAVVSSKKVHPTLDEKPKTKKKTVASKSKESNNKITKNKASIKLQETRKGDSTAENNKNELKELENKVAAAEKAQVREAHRATLLESQVEALKDKLHSTLTVSESKTASKMAASERVGVHRMAEQLGIDASLMKQLSEPVRTNRTGNKTTTAPSTKSKVQTVPQ